MVRLNGLTAEEFNLYNPPYVGILLLQSISQYNGLKKAGIHCALPYVIAPIFMSQQLSPTLPSNIRYPFSMWVSEHGGLLSSFPELSKSFVPIVNSAVSFLLQRGAIVLTAEGTYIQTKKHVLASDNTVRWGTDSMNASLKAARFLGKWMTRSPTVETVFAQLGIRP